MITVQKSSGLNTSANVYATAPSGCAANVSAKNVEAKVSAAVYYEQGAADVVLANETVARTTACTKSEPNGDQLGVMCDINADAGKFEVKDLADGTYKLKEHEAPTGYTKTDVWYTFVISDGQVTTVTRHENADDATGTTVGAIEIVFTDTRTKVTWNKIDGTDRAKIAGSSWTIAAGKVGDGSFTANGGTPITVTDCTSGSSCANGSNDENGDPGAFTVSGLPVNKSDEIYQLQEVGNPAAHTGKPTYYFKLTDSNENVALYKDVGLTDPVNNVIANPRVLGEVSWSKVSSENDSLLLAGSEWKVTQTSEFKYGNDGVTGTFEKLTTSKEYFVTDCMDACSSEGFADEDSSAGKFKLTGLPWGEYTLEENKAPDGYNLGGVVYKFTIGPSSYNGSAWSVALTVDGATGPADNKIENQPGVVLPGTGGDGNMKTLATGLLVAMASVATAGLALKVRRRRQ
ncbi:MSCRAMM family protein [Bifidobacterium pseudocatenulatum]|uniref:MSCRAMM family protein n=1 Tax=Bifidobacterium pseudocatenulatum TaxID=28026 RepID=UPI0022E630BF|nr:prealbumin-like fold domain-containing protein [Bifidobacterium pseudocatenulatum]